MDKKEVLVYFSDCPFFAGCENMIPNFLNSKEINNSYEVYFLYRKSDAYSIELKNRLLNSNLNCIALNLPNYNIHKSLLTAKNESNDLIYFVEDDYLHAHDTHSRNHRIH